MIVLKNHLYKQIENSCSQSSVKGVGRIVKTKDILLKTIWIVGVILLLLICSFSLYDVIGCYLAYPTTTSITDRLITDEIIQPSVLKDHIPPDVTLCNLNPFRSNHQITLQNENIPSFAEYVEVLENFKQSQEIVYQHFSNKLDINSLFGYYQYIGPDNAAKLSHSGDEFIVDCQILVLTLYGYQNISCDRDAQIKRYMTAEYFSCYTIGFTPELVDRISSRGFFISGIEATIYLDNIPTVPDTFVMDRNSAGIAVGIHEHGTVFVPEQDSVQAAGGMATTIRLSWELRRRLHAPHGNCVRTNKEVWSIDGKKYKYNLVACVSTCLQEEVKSTCGCIMGFYTQTETFTNLSITPYCLDLKEPFETVSNRSHCMLVTLDLVYEKCAKCPPLCREYRYRTSSSSTKWPRHNQVIPFYHKFVRNSSNSEIFSIYKQIDKLFKEGNLDEGNHLLETTSLIQDNFAKISVRLSSLNVMSVHDQAAVSFNDLLAKIGGTLNLYSGISCIIIVEIVDFFYNILINYGKTEKAEERTKACKVSPAF